MRTPWKMLADLVSGKSSKEDVDDIAPAKPANLETGTATDNEAARAKNEALEKFGKPEVVADPAEAAVVANEAQPVAETDPIDKPVTAEDTSADLASAAPAKEAGQSALPQRLSKSPTATTARRPAGPSKRVTTTPTDTAALVEKSAVDQPIASVATSGPKSVLTEMAELDREIEDLRRQLAEKLMRQNAQLRKLIDRYEGR